MFAQNRSGPDHDIGLHDAVSTDFHVIIKNSRGMHHGGRMDLGHLRDLRCVPEVQNPHKKFLEGGYQILSETSMELGTKIAFEKGHDFEVHIVDLQLKCLIQKEESKITTSGRKIA